MTLGEIYRRKLLFVLSAGLALPKWAVGKDEISPAVEIVPKVGDWRELARRGQVFEHWTPEQDARWEWYRLERFVQETWQTVGISLPIDMETGAAYEPADDYVRLDKIPAYVLNGELPELTAELKRQLGPSLFNPLEDELREPDPDVQARDGKPPSEWLCSLYAEELRSWLKQIDVPTAGVSGMTHWVHLVRDHSFDPRRIEGLTEVELAQLHSAAHFGY